MIIQKSPDDELKSNSLFQALKSAILNSVEPYTKEIFCIYDEYLYKDSYIEDCYKPSFIDSDCPLKDFSFFTDVKPFSLP